MLYSAGHGKQRRNKCRLRLEMLTLYEEGPYGPWLVICVSLGQPGEVLVSVQTTSICFTPWKRDVSEGELSEVD